MLRVADISRKTGVEWRTLRTRLANGMNIEDAVKIPSRTNRPRNEECQTFPDCFHCPYSDCIMSVEPKTGRKSYRQIGSMVIPYKRKKVSKRLKKKSWCYMTQEDVNEIRRERCRKCQYSHSGTCDYLLITGHRRGCRPDECTHYLDPKEGVGTPNETVVNL